MLGSRKPTHSMAAVVQLPLWVTSVSRNGAAGFAPPRASLSRAAVEMPTTGLVVGRGCAELG
ncbi:hypothetical protein ADK74_34650 [Streptomyces decoyicus]|nr:hypothetical protein ADK74_34650 [Streptomyces decoyicus]